MPRLSKPRRQKRELCFLNWLQQVLDQKLSPNNAFWLDRNTQIFAVRWVHAKSPLWNNECAELFKMWKNDSQRTWRNGGGEFDKSMKTNFRMNLRSANFLELTDTYEDPNFKYPFKVFKIVKTRVTLDEKQTEGKESLFQATSDSRPSWLKLVSEPSNGNDLLYPSCIEKQNGDSNCWNTLQDSCADYIPDILPWNMSDNYHPGNDFTFLECTGINAQGALSHNSEHVDRESLGPSTPTLFPNAVTSPTDNEFTEQLSKTSISSVFSFEADDLSDFGWLFDEMISEF